jgi:hypothetical protein
MCLSCGCGIPEDDHGNPDNLVYEDIERAADAEGLSVSQTIQNLLDSLGDLARDDRGA